MECSLFEAHYKSFCVFSPLSVQVAHQYGRWIILNKEDPIGTLGETVNQSDQIMLEQEWNFIGSSSPYDCYMQTGLLLSITSFLHVVYYKSIC